MDEIRAFIQEIIDNPLEDAHRLIFADYLEEQGDPRAEMIRLQFQLAEMSPFDKQRVKLRKRELELLRQHGGFGKVPKNVDVIETHGGFVDGVEVTVARFLKLQDDIFAKAPIRRLVLKSKSKYFSKLGESPHLEKMNHLTLKSNGASTKELLDLLTNPRLRHLKALDIHGAEIENGFMSRLVEAPNLASLQHFKLAGWNWGMDNLQPLIDSKVITRLESLSLSGASGRSIGRMSKSENFANLKELSISGSASGEAVYQLQAGPYCRELESLTVVLDDEARVSQAFAAKNPLPKLKHLSVHSRSGGSFLPSLLKNYPRLETLDLAANLLRDEEAILLSQSELLNHLDKLVLTGNQIGEAGATALAESPHRRKAMRLYLRSNPVPLPVIEQLRNKYGRTFGNFGKAEWNPRYYGYR